MNSIKYYRAFSAFLISLAITFGAFGAHILTPGLGEKYIRTLGTANQYFLFHGLALLVLSLYFDEHNFVSLRRSFILILTGIVLFSGSLYWIVLSDFSNFQLPSFVGPLTPLGGVSFIIAWILLGLHFIKSAR